MGDPKNTLSNRDAAWLAETFRRNRARFSGWRMEADPQSDPAPTDPPPDPSPTDPPASKTPPWGDPENFNAEKAWELIQNLRTEKGDPAKVTELEAKLAEVESTRQAQMDALAKALGVKDDDTPPDPAKLAEQITAEQSKTSAAETRAAAAERQLAVFKIAADPEVAGNAAALLDSASFLDSLKDIDPADTEKVQAAIETAIEKNPLFRASQAPATPPFPGGPRSSAPARAGSLGEAIAQKMTTARPS